MPMTPLPTIRPADARDDDAIFGLLASCFPSDAEGRLVAALRAAGRLTLSLVAERAGRIVGFVALSPTTLDDFPVNALGLGPLAVLAEARRTGVGAALVQAALAAVEVDFVVVLGDPAYYGRFGFEPAYARGLRDEYGGGDAFQVRGRVDRGGLIRYAPEFAAVGV